MENKNEFNSIIKENSPQVMTDALESYVVQTRKIHKIRVLKLKLLKGLGAFLLILSVLFIKSGETQAEMQHNIANQIIRFHVLANSDSAEDQALKLKVKNKVVLYMQDVLKDCKSKGEAEQLITMHKEDILQVARQVIAEEGYHYQVTAKLENHYFPVKTYGDLTFPEGDYEAFRILIGNAEGKNWWCVMFPNLCMVNETYTIVPEESKDQLHNVLSEEEYDSISKNAEPTPTPEEQPDVEYHFWLVDWFSSLF